METDLDALLHPLEGGQGWIVGQLGQSLDGRIATMAGHSHYINGPSDIERLHRLRALADAVVVGAGTVTHDDPQLTVRRVRGDNPVRVVLDPRARLDAALGVFRDGQAETLHVVGEEASVASPSSGQVAVLRMHVGGDGFDPHDIIAMLAGRGLRRVLVEGGGLTVSRFLAAGVLDRLHISVAPLLMGSGRPSITLPEIETLDQALRPSFRLFRLGNDVVFDLELEQGHPAGSRPAPEGRT